MAKTANKKQSNKQIAWVFRKSVTLPFDSEDPSEAWDLQGKLLEHCESFIFQIESAPNTGYLHYQGAFWLLNRNRHTWIQNTLGHFEYLLSKSKNATPKQTWTYGCKEETRVLGPWSHGEPPPDSEKDKRAEWVKFIALSEQGEFDKIKELMPAKYTCYYPTMKRIYNDTPKIPPDLDRRCGQWFWGPPETGKTMTAKSLGPHFMKRPNINWDGYAGQPIVIIDDLDESHQFLQRDLKIWGDKYAFQGKILYSNIMLRPEQVIITSNVRIDDVFPNPAHAMAIRSRYPETEFKRDPYYGMDELQRAQAVARETQRLWENAFIH